jgi:hypothetical protein
MTKSPELKGTAVDIQHYSRTKEPSASLIMFKKRESNKPLFGG